MLILIDPEDKDNRGKFHWVLETVSLLWVLDPNLRTLHHNVAQMLLPLGNISDKRVGPN